MRALNGPGMGLLLAGGRAGGTLARALLGPRRVEGPCRRRDQDRRWIGLHPHRISVAQGVSGRTTRAVGHGLNHDGTEAGPPQPRGFECDFGNPVVCRRGSDRITWRWPRGGARAAAAPRVPRSLKSDHGLYRFRSYCPANHTCFPGRAGSTGLRRPPSRGRPGEPTIPEPRCPPNGSGSGSTSPSTYAVVWYFTHARWRYAGDHDTTEAFLLTPACIWTGA
jgi:hypothetical protein